MLGSYSGSSRGEGFACERDFADIRGKIEVSSGTIPRHTTERSAGHVREGIKQSTYLNSGDVTILRQIHPVRFV